MLKRELTYEDFNGDEITEVFYFNISKPELVELEVEHNKGFAQVIEDIVKAENNKELVQLFKRIVLMAYGVKSDDGKRFEKSDMLRERFSQTAAYQSLFMELATVTDAAIIFMKGVMPKDMIVAVEDEEKKLKAVSGRAEGPKVPPKPPIPPTS